MELDYKLTEDEFVSVQMGRRRTMLRIQIALASFMVLFSLLVIFAPRIQDKGLAWLLLLGGVYLFSGRYLIIPNRLRKLFRNSPIINAQRHVSINAEGITTVLPNATEDVRWSAFQKVHELNGNFLLFYAPNSYYVMPERIFARENLEEFRARLREKGLL